MEKFAYAKSLFAKSWLLFSISHFLLHNTASVLVSFSNRHKSFQYNSECYSIILNGGISTVGAFFRWRNWTCWFGACVCSPVIFIICVEPIFFVNAFASHLKCGKLCGSAHLQVVISVFVEYRTFVYSYSLYTNFNWPRRDRVNVASRKKPLKTRERKIFILDKLVRFQHQTERFETSKIISKVHIQ